MGSLCSAPSKKTEYGEDTGKREIGFEKSVYMVNSIPKDKMTTRESVLDQNAMTPYL